MKLTQVVSKCAAMRAALIQVWLIIGLATSACVVEGDELMTERDRMIAELLTFDETAYFEQDPASANSIAPQALQYQFEGLILVAPRVIPTASRQSLPALFVSVESGARAATVPLVGNTVVVATNADTGLVRFADAFPADPSKSPGDRKKRSAAAVAPVPDEPPLPPDKARMREMLGADRTAGGSWLDFKELLDLPWTYGRYALRLISFDQVSNPAYVSLTGEAAAAASFPADAALEIAKDTSPTGSESGELPRFVASSETPVFQGNGAALAVGAAAPVGDGTVLPVHGALRLPIAAEQIVAQLVEDDATDFQAEGLPSAILRSTLLLMIKDVIPPASVEIDIPIWADHELQPGDLVEAAFSLDLFEALDLELGAGTYYLYMIAGAYISQPTRIDVVGTP